MKPVTLRRWLIVIMMLIVIQACFPGVTYAQWMREGDTKDAKGVTWYRGWWQPIENVVEVVMQDREAFIERCGGGSACAEPRIDLNVCFVISLYEPLPKGSYIEWHEKEMHCRKGMNHEHRR